MKGAWNRKPKNSTSVVFVHGILSSGETCWKNDNGSYWPQLLQKEEDLKEVGIYTFSYQTNILSGSYRLSDIVDSLKELLRLDRVLESNRIVFVCHSMGGIVVRKFLVERASDIIDKQILVGLFLLSSPSLGSSYANWLEPLSKLLGHAQASILTFTDNNAWLNDLDKEFQNLKSAGKMKILGKELYEDKFIVLPGLLKKQLVQSFSAAKYFGEQYKVPGSDHFSIAKPDSGDAIQHRLLRDFVMAVVQEGEPDKVHAYAVGLSIGPHQDALGLWVSNRGTHVIRDVEINAIPDAEEWHEATHGSLPAVEKGNAGVEVVYPIMGGWLYAKVGQLNPNRGLMVASYTVEEGNYTTMDFDFFWNDHEGMQRKAHVVADVAEKSHDLAVRARR